MARKARPRQPVKEVPAAALPASMPAHPRFGFVAVIGAPNAGKSTLVNTLVGAKVTIVNLDNKDVWSGTTNADGLAQSPPLAVRNPEESWKFAFLVTAEKDGDVAYVGSDWNEGIEPWEFGAGYTLREAGDVLRGSVFTARGVYKRLVLQNNRLTGAVLYGDTADGLMYIGPHRNYPHHVFALGGSTDSVTGAFLAARLATRAVQDASEKGDEAFGFTR